MVFSVIHELYYGLYYGESLFLIGRNKPHNSGYGFVFAGAQRVAPMRADVAIIR